MRLSEFELVTSEADNDGGGGSPNPVTSSIRSTPVSVPTFTGDGASVGTLREGKDDPNGSDTSYGNYNVFRKQKTMFNSEMTFDVQLSAKTEPDNLDSTSYVNADVIKLVKVK